MEARRILKRNSISYINRGKMQYKILKNKLKRNLNDYGASVCFKKMISHLLKPLFEHKALIFYKIELKEKNNINFYANSFIFKLIGPKDVSLIGQIESMEEWLHGRLEGKLLKGGICMAVLDNDKVIGFYLAALNEVFIPLLKVRVVLRDGDSWGEQITIIKNYRRRNLATELKNRIYMELKNRGINNVYGHVAGYNKASLKSVEKFLSKKLSIVHYVKIFHFERLWYRKLPSSYQREKQKFEFEKTTRKECYHSILPSKIKRNIFTIDISSFDP